MVVNKVAQGFPFLSMPLDLFLILIALQLGHVFTLHTREHTGEHTGKHTREDLIENMKEHTLKFMKIDYKKFTIEPSGNLKNTFFGKEVLFSPFHDLCKSSESSEQSKSHQCRDFWCIYDNCISLPRPISLIIRIAMPALRNLNLLPFVLPFL